MLLLWAACLSFMSDTKPAQTNNTFYGGATYAIALKGKL